LKAGAGTFDLGNRSTVIGAVVLVALATLAIWIRVPYVPAPSGGDEVWWGEGAYWLLKEGRLRWDWMANPQGVETLVFWPPTVALFQTGFFWLLGLNEFSLCATSAVACTALILLTAACARRQGAGLALSCVLGLLPFALFGVERRFMQVRMEPWVAVFAIASLNLLDDASARGGRAAAWAAFLSGACAGVAALSYYPLAPFVSCGLGASALFAFFRGGNPGSLGRLVAFGSGAGLIGCLFAVWISQDLSLFARQILGGEGASYVNPIGHSGVLWQALCHPGSLGSIMAFETVGSFLLGIAAFLWAPGRVRTYGLATAITALAFAVYSLTDRMAPVGALAASTAAAWLGARATKVSAWALGSVACLSGFGFVRVVLVAVTGFVQAEGRTYAKAAEWLRGIVGEQAPVMTDNVGWLALREHRGPGQMIHLNGSFDFSHAFRSTAQRTAEGIKRFRYYVVGERPGDGPFRFEASPALEKGVADGWVVERARFRLPWRALPWAAREPYGIMVLENMSFAGRQ